VRRDVFRHTFSSASDNSDTPCLTVSACLRLLFASILFRLWIDSLLTWQELGRFRFCSRIKSLAGAGGVNAQAKINGSEETDGKSVFIVWTKEVCDGRITEATGMREGFCPRGVLLKLKKNHSSVGHLQNSTRPASVPSFRRSVEDMLVRPMIGRRLPVFSPV